MLRELAHFARSLPVAARLKGRLDHAALLDHIESALDQAGKAQRRSALVSDLQGEILEIGAGSGRMLCHYPAGAHVTALDPDEELLALAAGRAKQAKARVELQVGVGEELPFRSATFDAVVCVSVLCCVSSVEKSLREIARVLRPGGALRLIEHVRSHETVPGTLQHVFNPVWRSLNGAGCNMDRDPKPMLDELGFEILAIDSFQLFVREFPAAFVNEVIRAIRR